ncbi:SPRY domain-containing SOCS box protein 3-like isoform X1 [Seriola dumerili]|uniref:SPRY domain-containing SOCS box protein 3-like isoform X1 n=2 Tax=Seriola dumerili TaxID=41447 RepID=UPI000BBED0FA|nr:SPRY domain-containing SOCS box protein 3-like isoform X1 [Seriola dumerili]XP_022598819.1 SPRY domain-containing SOCS box protein 3-like isoform X1 [Seriola dumerili]
MSHCKTVYRKTTARAAMLRRGRNGRTRHLAWSEIRQETDAMEVIQTLDREQWEGQTTTQISDLESDVDHLASSQTVTEVVALPCTVPVIGESFCQCDRQEELSPGYILISDCVCGEEDQGFDWVWDENCKSSGAFLSCDNRKVSFHSDYSCGTAAIRGTKELADGQHFWEVKMTSPVYGTDMMVGIGTSEVNLEKFKYSFGSLLGHDEDSWGLSYTGLLQHKGDKVKFSSRFGQGSIIGLHLDTWHGTLTFYKNRHCIGVAATRLQNKKFYPMVCSTAAKSSMKVIRACYTPTSLQYLCCARLRQMMPCCPDMLGALELPPGLRTLLHTQLGWVFTLSSSPEASEQHSDLLEDFYEETSLPSSPSPSPSPIMSPVSSLSACASPSPCTSPFPDTVSYQCPCQTSPQTQPCTCHCPPTPPSSDYDSCCSEPEEYQCKRCRWT